MDNNTSKTKGQPSKKEKEIKFKKRINRKCKNSSIYKDILKNFQMQNLLMLKPKKKIKE